MSFWLSAAALSALAIGFIVWPLFKKGRAGAFQVSASHNGLIIIALSLIVPGLSLLIYWQWGAFQSVSQAGSVRERLVEVKEEINHSGSRQSLIQQFEDHLKQKPQNPKGWYLLGKLYLHDARYPEAVKALKRSVALKSDDLDALLALAQALYILDGNKLSAESQSLLLQVIKKVPNSPIALTLLGMDEYNKGQYRQALTYFEQLLPLYSAESPEGQRLLEIIAQAQKHLYSMR